jgi:hypothetical protein
VRPTPLLLFDAARIPDSLPQVLAAAQVIAQGVAV